MVHSSVQWIITKCYYKKSEKDCRSKVNFPRVIMGTMKKIITSVEAGTYNPNFPDGCSQWWKSNIYVTQTKM